jgi:hypothetical protein
MATATQEYAASIQGVCIRVTRLDASGNLLNGAGDSYTTSAFMRLSFTPEYEEGDEMTEKSANGAICVSYKAPDTLKRITMELAICEPDPELTNLLSGGLLLRKNYGSSLANSAASTLSIGWASPGVGDDPAGNGVAIEAWSFAIRGGKKDEDNPYFHWVFPYVKMRQSGDRVIENGMLANTFEGYGLGASTDTAFGDGLDGRWEFPVATMRPYSYARSNWAPTGIKGFYQWFDSVSLSVNSKTATTSVATVTTGGATAVAHGLVVGQTVVMDVGTSAMNGTKVITAVPTPTTFSYAYSGIAISPTAISAPYGTAVSVRGPVDVATLALPDADDVNPNTDFNVPGSLSYNADNAIDYIINSVEDPTS